MKIQKLIAVLLIVPFLVGMYGCNKGPGKEKVIEVSKKVTEWAASGALKNKIVGDLKNAAQSAKTIEEFTAKQGEIMKGIEKTMTDEMLKIVKAAGFKDEKEIEEVSKKFKDDPDVKKATEAMGNAIMAVSTDIQKEAAAILEELTKRLTPQPAAEGEKPAENPEQPKEEKAPEAKK